MKYLFCSNFSLMRELESRIVSELSVENVLDGVKRITAFGERICGTVEEHQALRWAASQLESLGLEVSMEPFKVISWKCRRAELRVVRPEEFEVRCAVVGYSPSTPEGGLKAEVVFVGDGLDRDYEGVDARGKIALALWNDDYWMAHQYWVAVKNGASALIVAYTSPIVHTEAIGVNGRPLPIPAVIIPSDDFERVKKLMEKGPVELEMLIEAETNPSAVSYNVVGRLEGERWPDRYVIACGHVDSWYYGANDNACAVAAVIEMARVLSKYGHKRTILFLVTGAEEAGSLNWFYYLQGSNAYVKRHSEELRKIVGMFNGELLGHGEKFHVEATPDLVSFLKRNAEELGITSKLRERAVIRCPPSDWQDAYSFAVEGVPSCCMMWVPYEEYHSPDDTIDIIEPDKLRTSIRLLGLSVYRMANVEVLPYDFVYYAETLLEGNEDMGFSELLEPGLGMRTAKGLRELASLASGMVSFDEAIREAEVFLKLSKELSKAVEMIESRDVEFLNDTLREVSEALNSEFIGVGGPYGFHEMLFPRLRAVDDMAQIREAVEALKKVNGALLDCPLKSSIEVLGRKLLYVDVYEDIRSLEEKLEFLRVYVAGEVKSVSDVLRAVNGRIKRVLEKVMK